MLRAVVDVNVLVSAAISSTGPPAQIVRAWMNGEFEMVISPHLLEELERVLSNDKLRQWIAEEDAEQYVRVFESAEVIPDPTKEPPVRPADEDDAYLVALAAHARVPIVSGDHHLLDLADRIPVFAPHEFAAILDQG